MSLVNSAGLTSCQQQASAQDSADIEKCVRRQILALDTEPALKKTRQQHSMRLPIAKACVPFKNIIFLVVLQSLQLLNKPINVTIRYSKSPR